MLSNQAVSVLIRINQAGYNPNDTKIALVLTSKNLHAQSFQVIGVPGTNVFLTAKVGHNRGSYGHFSHLYELNFSALTKAGTYRIQLGADSSPPFPVATNAYPALIAPSLQFFRVQRCGDTAPLLHGPCHLHDGFAAGGWHDSGDYLKFVITHGYAVVLLLLAYQHQPDPAILAEARVGLDWLMKMWDAQHTTLYYQVGDYHDHSDYGWRLPEGDDTKFPPRPVWACDAGKGANVAGKAAAALALGAVLLNDTNYLAAAKQIYAFGQVHPHVQNATGDPDSGAYYEQHTWQADMALAAAELYRATGVATYLADARSYAQTAGVIGLFDWSSLHALAQYEIAKLDPTYVATAAKLLTQDLASYRTHARTNRFHVAADFSWGCAENIAGAALTALWYEDLTGDNQFRDLAVAQRDYLLGVNPWGVCWINSVGTVWPHYPHHQIADLLHAELVGFWDEGPVPPRVFKAEHIRLHSPDAYANFQTDAAVYHDDVEDYTTNEPTITANAIGLALSGWWGTLP
jgi:hypothetical protein